MCDFKVNGINVKFTKHAKQRLKDRDITTKEIAWRLHDRYRTIKNYKYSGELLIYNSKGLFLLFKMEEEDRILKVISVGDFEHKNPGKAKVI